MLLVISNTFDVTTDYLIEGLDSRGLNCFRLNTDNIPKKASVSISLNEKEEDLYIEDEMGRRLKGDAVSAVYFRQPRVTLERPDEDPEYSFFVSEISGLQSGAWRLISTELWLNHPIYLWYASNKIQQLKEAKKVGLQIPPTLITSQRGEVVDFANKQNEESFAFKAVREAFVSTEWETLLAGTKRFSLEDMEEWPANFLPMICQSYIESSADIRAIVVDDKVAAARIHQEGKKVATDWRTTSCEVTTEETEIPENVKTSLISLVYNMGLGFGAVDLLETQSGEYVFLEVNPNGQWAWLDFEAGMDIRGIIIDSLERRANSMGGK